MQNHWLNLGKFLFRGKFQETPRCNWNHGRVYSRELWERVMKQEEFIDLSQVSSAGGRYKAYERLSDEL